jgi:Trk-type K+ transport system membrane component
MTERRSIIEYSVNVANSNDDTNESQRIISYWRTTIENITLEINKIILELNEYLLGHRIFNVSFASYIILLTLFGAGLLWATGGGNFVDAWFLSTSAVGGGGLSVRETKELTNSCFRTLQFLMFFGSGPVLILPILAYRVHRLGKYIDRMIFAVQDNENCSEEDRNVIVEYFLIYSATKWLICLSVIYIFICVFVGSIILCGFLLLHDLEGEIKDRGISYYENALFLSISAFSNCGLTMSSNSLYYLSNNAGALIVIALLIVAGNTLFPVFMRCLIEFILYVLVRLKSTKTWGNYVTDDKISGLKYLLKRPRKLSPQLYGRKDTLFILQFFVLSYIVVMISFISSNEYENKYGSKATVVGLSLFQIVNIRHAGFQVFNFRDLTQNTLLIFALSMFLAPVPYIGLLHSTGM